MIWMCKNTFLMSRYRVIHTWPWGPVWRERVNQHPMVLYFVHVCVHAMKNPKLSPESRNCSENLAENGLSSSQKKILRSFWLILRLNFYGISESSFERFCLRLWVTFDWRPPLHQFGAQDAVGCRPVKILETYGMGLAWDLSKYWNNIGYGLLLYMQCKYWNLICEMWCFHYM